MFWGEKSDLGVKSGFVVGKMPSFLDESEIWVEKVSSMEEKRGPEGKKQSYFWEKSGVFERRDRSFGEEWYGVYEEKWSCLWEKSGILQGRAVYFQEKCGMMREGKALCSGEK